MPGQPVLAGVDGASTAKAQSGVAADSGSRRGAIVVAERDGGKNWGGGKNWAGGWNDGKKNWNQGGNWNKKTNQWSGKKNYNQNYNKYYNKHWGKGWSNYNNQWNKNWNRRAYVRSWNRRPYYGEFVGGVVLGSLLAAAGAGVVPYAPEPYLCWYWAALYDPRLLGLLLLRRRTRRGIDRASARAGALYLSEVY